MHGQGAIINDTRVMDNKHISRNQNARPQNVMLDTMTVCSIKQSLGAKFVRHATVIDHKNRHIVKEQTGTIRLFQHLDRKGLCVFQKRAKET
jgi:hypothetical protein